MDMQYVIQLGRSAIYTTLLVAGPMLAFSLMIGLVIAIFQAITQIQEMTLTFIPKIISVALALILFLPWMMSTVLSFTAQIFNMIPALAH